MSIDRATNIMAFKQLARITPDVADILEAMKAQPRMVLSTDKSTVETASQKHQKAS